MDKPRTFNGDLDHLPPALERLTAERRWLVWQWKMRRKKSGEPDLDNDGNPKWTKPPFQARFPKHHAATDDPTTWGTYLDAVDAVKYGEADGIGYALFESKLGAVDLDKCRDVVTGKVDDWAEELHAEAGDAYHEVTVSGQGTRILGITNGPTRQRRFNLGDGAGIELYRNTKKYITISGNERGTCAELPPIDDLIDTLEERFDTRKGRKRDFNDAGSQARDYADLIHNGAPDGDRSEEFQRAVWHLASKGMTAEEITDELARHPAGIGAKYADRLHEEVLRSYGKWCSRRRADATGCDGEAAPWPQIHVVPGELPRMINEAETALIGLGRDIYQRGGMIVRPVLLPTRTFHDGETEAWRILEVPRGHLAETLARAAQWLKYDGRRRKWVGADVPGPVVEAYQGRAGEWRLPVLTGVTGTPCLRRDGSLHDAPGYDSRTGLLYKPECLFAPIPARPTRDDALAALRLFDDLVRCFPFVTPADKAVVLSAILTALDRHNMASAPLHGFSATAAGTGKSKLADIVSILATGRSCAVKAQSESEEELEKRLDADLLQGAAIITIDNCERPLCGAALCQILTQRTKAVRVLGVSKNVDASTAVTVMATGNNLQVARDLTRRVVLCSLDAGVEHPELRKFDWDAAVVAREQRGRLVAAALTILRGWHCAGTRTVVDPLGSFEEWSQRIRSPLLWLGCADPCETTLQVGAEDPEVEQLREVMTAWKECIGPKTPMKVRDIINKALLAPDLHNALMSVAMARGRVEVSPERLGRWLNHIKGRIVTKMSIRKSREMKNHQLWYLDIGFM
jgi:hypothetical protein